jgi:integrase
MTLTDDKTDKYNTLNLSDLGVNMKGIYPRGRCPVEGCIFTFQVNSKGLYECPEHKVKANQFEVVVHYKNKRFSRTTDFDGEPLITISQAEKLTSKARADKKYKRFDPTEWRDKTKKDYRFNSLLNKWLKAKEDKVRQRKLSPSYLAKLKQYINIYYVQADFADLDIREVKAYHIRNFEDNFPGRLSLKYQKNIMEALRAFFRWCQIFIDSKIEVPHFEPIEVPEKDIEVISLKERALILDNIPEAHRPIFTFYLYQGCRPSEVRALKWKDIQGEVVTYQRNFSQDRLVEWTKTRRIRKNPLFPEVMAVLPQRTFPESFVFTHGVKYIRHYSKNLLNRIFHGAATAAGIKINVYNAGKHSFGTNAVNNGVPVDVLQKWFGHSNRAMTEKYARIDLVKTLKDNVRGLK